MFDSDDVIAVGPSRNVIATKGKLYQDKETKRKKGSRSNQKLENCQVPHVNVRLPPLWTLKSRR
jgi:hypothetical protein